MKRDKIVELCKWIDVALIISFVVKTIIDRFNYTTTLNSAPFYLWVLVNVMYFIVPALLVFCIGVLIKHFNDKEEGVDCE